MRSKIESVVAVGLLILVVALGATAMQVYNRKAEEQTMDKIEVRYDADGPFIMIDSTLGLIGLYNATDVIGHIWTDSAKGSPDGVFSLVIYGDRIGLGRPESEWIHEIKLGKRDMKKLGAMTPGIPVLVY